MMILLCQIKLRQLSPYARLLNRHACVRWFAPRRSYDSNRRAYKLRVVKMSRVERMLVSSVGRDYQ